MDDAWHQVTETAGTGTPGVTPAVQVTEAAGRSGWHRDTGDGTEPELAQRPKRWLAPRRPHLDGLLNSFDSRLAFASRPDR